MLMLMVRQTNRASLYHCCLMQARVGQKLLSKLNSWSKTMMVKTTGWQLCLLTAVLCWSASPAVWAGKYAYGEQFVRAGHSWTNLGQVQGSPLSSSVPEPDEAAYEQRVVELEMQGGPYADALAETLTGLGRYHRQNGDLEAAQRFYRRALHVVRVNEGLYSERQLPILRELLDGYRMAGDLQALDDRYNYYFRLYGNGQAPFTDVRLRASLAYLRWQREAVRLEIDEKESPRLLALYQLNETLLGEVAADASVALHWYRQLVLSQLRNLYLLEDRFAPAGQNRFKEPATPLFGSEWSQEDFNKKRLETMQRGNLTRGVDLLQALISRTAGEEDGTELARLHLELGDWYQWHGGNYKAGEQYALVVKLLAEEKQKDMLQQWLGEPVELPDNGVFWQFRPANASEPNVVVNVRYDVSARGRASNMQAEVSSPGDKGLVNRLKRKLGQIRFRPRWVSGVAEPVSQVQRDYEFTN